MRAIQSILVLAAWALLACRPATAAPQPDVPPLQRAVPVHEGRLEVEAGQEWTARIAVPACSEEERPLLQLKACVLGGSGCNYVMQVLIDGVPLSESVLRRRLLNKLPYFDPPNTDFHFAWYDSRLNRWMTIFTQDGEATFGGTGRDADFLFDLTGMATPGKSITIAFRHMMPELPAAVKRDRAPLVISDAKLGVLSVSEVARLRRAVEAAEEMRPIPVNPALPADSRPGERPYEVVWTGRQENPRAQVAFGDLKGWSASVIGEVDASVQLSEKYRLWRDRGAQVTWGPNEKAAAILLRPAEPILIEGRFDAANLWLYSETERMKERHPNVVAHLVDAAGRDFAIDMGTVTSTYWQLLHGVLESRALAGARFPMHFTGLEINVGRAEKPRRLTLESLAFYTRNRKPFTANTRPAKPAFPISDDGMLPTPPRGVKTQVEAAAPGALFTCRTQAGVLQYRVDPTKGLFDGISARWNDGPWFQPMAGGELKHEAPGSARAGAPKLVSAKLANRRLTARWEQGTTWEATYTLRGSTLVVDVTSAGGAATGLGFGRVVGLPEARPIAVPYLTYGMGPGPLVACGRDVFVSVYSDWYHSLCSRINGQVSQGGDGVMLMTGTEYFPLTNGRRNDLRERVLVTVSPEFAEVLPNIPHPATPHLERLAPYMFAMASYIQPNLWRTMKRHGIDHVITCDFARFYVQDFAEGFSARWKPHPSLTMEQIQAYRKEIKELGYLFGAYSDLRDWFPLNEFFDENCVALRPNGDLAEGWFGNYRAKANYLPVLARLVGEKAHKYYAPDSAYMDTHSCQRPDASDFEAGVPGAGIARDQIYFNGDSMLETRKWYGTVMSEGAVRWMYAGIADMDYASLFMGEDASKIPPLVDFDLLKIHPLNHGTMMGYAPSVFFRDAQQANRLYGDKGEWPAPVEFHQYVSASLAYGHMLIIGYSYLPPLSRMIQLYALMQGVQKEYLTDRVTEIHYHNGRNFVSTSQALREDSRKLGRVRVRYSRGLTVHINYNPEQEWEVEGYRLPPYGWLITKPGEILAFSALIDGRRVDYTRCPEYIYLNAGDRPARVEAVEAQGAVWLKREAKGWRLVPCGNLGPWDHFPAEGLPEFHKDMRLKSIPADRGCGAIAVDTRALLSKAPAQVRIQARNEAYQPATAKVQAGERLSFTPEAGVTDYLLE